jgi:2'-5' RNA ligase
MHRLFVALPLPDDISDLLLDLEDGPEGLRWVHADSLHLTLRFIGEVDGAQAEDVAAALSALSSPTFDLRLGDVGCFAHRRHGALWAGVHPKEPVSDLARKVDRAVQSAGLPAETRAYHPHVTLARWSGSRPPIEAWLQRHAELASRSWRADSFILYESHLGRHGPQYETIASIALRD